MRQAYDYWQNQPDTSVFRAAWRREAAPPRPEGPAKGLKHVGFHSGRGKRPPDGGRRPAAATAPAHRGNASNRPIVLTVSPPRPNRTQRPADPRGGCNGLRHPGAVRGDRARRSRRRTAAIEGWRSPWCEREAGVGQRPATHIAQTTPETLHTQRPRGLTRRGEDAEAPVPGVLGCVTR